VRREIDFVDYQKIRFRDSGPSFARNLFASGNVDYIDCKIREFRAERGGKIVAT
jgi:hypothetical protein